MTDHSRDAAEGEAVTDAATASMTSHSTCIKLWSSALSATVSFIAKALYLDLIATRVLGDFISNKRA